MKDDPISIIDQADAKLIEARVAQDLQDIKDMAERHERRMQAYRDWVLPENVAARRKEHEETAAKILAATKAAVGELEFIPLPDPLPKHMDGQSMSTIQAMLRQERDLKEPLNFRDPRLIMEDRAPAQVTVKPLEKKVAPPKEEISLVARIFAGLWKR